MINRAITKIWSHVRMIIILQQIKTSNMDIVGEINLTYLIKS